MKFDDITRQSLLYDFYGELLTERQKEVMELYNEENLSLAEIAEEFGISRQGVHDALHKAQKALEEYERKLGLVERFSATSEAISKISSQIDKTITMAAAETSESASGKSRTGVANQLRQIRSEIEQLEI
ncbi:MAG: YlxM family DNA-binding protein [Firmicutes bacterium]|nr:YlxM family DNA-binding protein [Bacillota bacterium]